MSEQRESESSSGLVSAEGAEAGEIEAGEAGIEKEGVEKGGVEKEGGLGKVDRRRSWSEAVRAFLHPRILGIFFLGISAGIPLFLVFGTLSVWLREAGVARSTVTFFSWAVLGYSFKFVWAPVIDALPLPVLGRLLGRRRSWLLLSQLAVIGALLWMAFTDPQQSLAMMGLAATLLGFSSATQDICIDAYRIEAVERDLQAMMSSSYIAGYRLGMLLASAGALELASLYGSSAEAYSARAWTIAYAAMAGAMLIGVVTTLVIREPEVSARRDHLLRGPADYLRFVGLFLVAAGIFVLGFVLGKDPAEAAKAALGDWGLRDHLAGFLTEAARLLGSIGLAALAGVLMVKSRAVPRGMVQESWVEPIADFVRRFGKVGLWILVLVGTYRISDLMMMSTANVFYVDHGFTKEQIARIAKTFGLMMTIGGGFLGGVLSVRYGLTRSLLIGAVSASASNLLFALLATMDNDPRMLVVVIAADNLAMGLASAAFVAYLSSLTSIQFTATQYALFSSIMTLFPKLVGGYSGTIVDAVGYPWFFVGTALVGVPVLFLIWKVAGAEDADSVEPAPVESAPV